MSAGANDCMAWRHRRRARKTTRAREEERNCIIARAHARGRAQVKKFHSKFHLKPCDQSMFSDRAAYK